MRCPEIGVLHRRRRRLPASSCARNLPPRPSPNTKGIPVLNLKWNWIVLTSRSSPSSPKMWFRTQTLLHLLVIHLVLHRPAPIPILHCVRCDMTCSDEDHGKNRRPGVEDRGWSHRSRGRLASCAVCTVHVQMRSASFLVEP